MQTDAQQLAAAVAADEARRSGRWQLRFRIVWGSIVALLIVFILVSLNVEIGFISTAAPFILQGIGLTLQIGRAHV